MAAAAVVSGSSAMPALLVALLACAAARLAVFVGGSACDGAMCFMGTCMELPTPIPSVNTYGCDCYPGWTWPVNVTGLGIPLPLPLQPCAIPTCPSDLTCYSPKMPVLGNATGCYMDCGPDGKCVTEPDHPLELRCECNAGATNVKNNPYLPCVKNCVIGDNGCPVRVSTLPPPPPPPPSSTAPPGPVSLRNRLQLWLLVASLAALHTVVV